MLLTLAPLQTIVHSVLLSPGTCPRTRVFDLKPGTEEIDESSSHQMRGRASNRKLDETVCHPDTSRIANDTNQSMYYTLWLEGWVDIYISGNAQEAWFS